MHSPDQLVVIFAGVGFDGVRRSARSLSEALSHHVAVLYVDPTSSPMHGNRSITLRPPLERVAGDLYHLRSISIPAHTRIGVRTLAQSAMRASVRAAIKQIGLGAPSAVVLQTPQNDVLGQFDEKTSVYWATDSFAAGSNLMGVDHETLAAAERRAVSHADVVIAVSDRLAANWAELGARTAVVPHGVDMPTPMPEQAVPDDLTLRAPLAGVVGTLSGRLDFEILERVADSGVSVVLIGPTSFRTDRSAFDDLCARDNVEFLGAKDHAELARYYAHIDVGLVPYTLSEFNMDAAPLKPLEYLAAGLPVVSTELPGVIAIGSQDIVVTRGAAEFSAATQLACRTARTPELEQRRRSHLAGWSWDARALEVLSVIDSGGPTDVT
ncbi:MAG: glycosyltransferase [Acidimicrobiia bacterium]|nr:MAG: glycosyltransferase [Acidimicrobiia bacterium]